MTKTYENWRGLSNDEKKKRVYEFEGLITRCSDGWLNYLDALEKMIAPEDREFFKTELFKGFEKQPVLNSYRMVRFNPAPQSMLKKPKLRVDENDYQAFKEVLNYKCESAFKK